MVQRTLATQYAVALLCVYVANRLGVALQPTLGDGFPFATMIVAVMISGWYGGFGPGFLTSLLGALAIVRDFLVLTDDWSIEGVESQAGVLLYLVVTIGIAIVCGSMRKARFRAEQRTADVVRALEEKLLIERNLNRTAGQLERSDAFHRLITELTSDFTFRIDFENGEPHLEYISPGFTTVTGYTLDQVRQRGGWASLLHPDDADTARRMMEQANSGDMDRSEVRILNSNGEVCWLRYLTQPHRSATGEIVGLVGAAQHITQQKQLEEVRQHLMTELAEKNAFIEAVLVQVPVGIIVAEAETGKLLTSNREAKRLASIANEPGAGVGDIGSIYSLRGYRPDGSMYQSGQWPIERALRGEVVQAEKIALDCGNSEALRLSVNAGPVFDRDGHIIAAVSVLHDESERCRSEERVQESQRFLRCSLDSLASHIAVLDEDGQILEVNEAWRRFADDNNFTYLRYGVGSNYLKPFESEDAACGDGREIARGIRKVMQGSRETFEYEYPCHSREEQRWFLLRVTRFKTPGPTRVVVAHENVTKLRQAMDALRDADRRKDEFLATLAHELRNPLAPIRNAIQILKLPGCDSETTAQTLDMIQRQTSQLTRLVDDLMDVSRVMRGKIELRLENVKLDDVIQQAIETAGPLISSRHHTLEVNGNDEPLRVRADPVRLSQILGNLITNAAKYTEPHGRIALTARRQDETAVICIEDNGIGIEADKLNGIFDLFMQVDHGTTRAQGGLGIGLTLVKNLIELHGGTVEVESAGLGKGSRFTVRMPLAPQPHTSQGQSLDFSHSAVQSPRRVLIVDDNRDAAISLAMLLKTLGHHASVAHSGESALEHVAQDRPDILFLDIGMPGMDGYEVARRLRADPKNNHLCLAALTGWGQVEDRRRSSEAGFDHHIVKPPELATLLKIIAGARSVQALSQPV